MKIMMIGNMERNQIMEKLGKKYYRYIKEKKMNGSKNFS